MASRPRRRAVARSNAARSTTTGAGAASANPSSAVDNAADITHARENFELISLCSSPRAQPRLRVRCGRYIAGSRARRDRRCSITNVRRRNDARADCRDDHTQAVVLKKHDLFAAPKGARGEIITRPRSGLVGPRAACMKHIDHNELFAKQRVIAHGG